MAIVYDFYCPLQSLGLDSTSMLLIFYLCDLMPPMNIKREFPEGYIFLACEVQRAKWGEAYWAWTRDPRLLQPLTTKGQVLYSSSTIFTWMIRYWQDFAEIFIRILELKIPSLIIALCNMIKNPTFKKEFICLEKIVLQKINDYFDSIS